MINFLLYILFIKTKNGKYMHLVGMEMCGIHQVGGLKKWIKK